MGDVSQTAEECTEFAEMVLSKFIESKQPLETARRSDLNALSRAYFLLDDIEMGIKTMRILLDRKQIPTSRELGVILASMAALSPRRAGQMMQLMLDKGIRPEVGDFGAIIHEASIRGDDELVGALVSKAHELGHEQLSMEGLHSLIRFSIRFRPAKGGERPVEEAETLTRVLRMMKALMQADHVPTPWMGARCARASLRVNQARLAYEFWRLLVRDKEDWNHPSQQELRVRISRALKREMRSGLIKEEWGRPMISDLEGSSATVGFSERAK